MKEPRPTAHLVAADVSTHRALEWLLRQRAEDWGWGGDTPKVVLALQLANSHHEAAMTPGRLAQYTLALNALCRDARQFHGHDLIGSLQHHEAEHDLDFALSSLAVCSAGAHVRKRQIRRLLDIAARATDHNADTLSAVLLALNCIVRDHRNRNLDHYVRKPGLALAEQQHSDGGFGNLHNGSFGDVSTTTEVVLALGPRHLSSIRDLNCGNTAGNFTANANETVETTTRDSDFVIVTYTLWVGTNVTENYTISVTVEKNSKFYHVMQIAAEQDSHYAFEAIDWPNGHYVHTIAGYKEEPSRYRYWLLYEVPVLPEPSNPPGNNLITPVGVDSLIVEDGDHYLFWYKKL
ncbi:Uncharacterized protein C0J52_02988 [Blattella germanica]|nr:Uncharacterized protein C0J52_02988 [Blattella germanica]